MALTREQILASACDGLPRKKVTIPEWGGDVYVKTMTATEKDSFEQAITKSGKLNLVGVRGHIVARCVVDEEGKRVFTDDDAEALGEMPAHVIDRILPDAKALNAITEKDVEDLAKN